MYAIRKNGMVCASCGGDGEHTLCGDAWDIDSEAKYDPEMKNMTWKVSGTGIVTCQRCASILESLQGTQYRNGILHGRPMKLKISDLPTLAEMRKAIERT